MPKLSPSRLSKSAEDYLKTIWLSTRDGPVATGTVASALGVTDASVSERLGKLSEQGLVRYTPYHGAQLTEGAERAAPDLLRRHRLLETFLAEYLGYGCDEVHGEVCGEAEALEHAVSARFTERLAARLGHPAHDPHGNPIPAADGTLPDTPDLPLADLGVPITTILHGEQGFRYHRTACAGDVVTVDARIADIYDKKNGALAFIVKESRAVNQRDELVAELRTVIVVRQDTQARATTLSRWATSCPCCSCRRSPARRLRCSAAHRATTTRSTSTR